MKCTHIRDRNNSVCGLKYTMFSALAVCALRGLVVSLYHNTNDFLTSKSLYSVRCKIGETFKDIQRSSHSGSLHRLLASGCFPCGMKLRNIAGSTMPCSCRPAAKQCFLEKRVQVMLLLNKRQKCPLNRCILLLFFNIAKCI